jgi:hypothetical protein
MDARADDLMILHRHDLMKSSAQRLTTMNSDD